MNKSAVKDFIASDYSILSKPLVPLAVACSSHFVYCWFSHDLTKIQTTKLLILLIFYFHDV